MIPAEYEAIAARAEELHMAAGSPCDGCGYHKRRCRELNREQRKCCPDCDHRPHSPAIQVVAALRERDNTIARVRDVLDDYDGLEREAIPKLSTHTWMHQVRAALNPQETP